MARERIVIDASIAIALVHDEPDSRAIRAAVAAWLLDDVVLVVPDHFWLEFVNPLARRHGYDGSRLLEVVRELDELPLTTIPTVRAQLVLALSLMDEHALTAYDAAYLALAQAIAAPLASTDRVMLEAAGTLGLDPRGGRGTDRERRVTEEPAAYAAGTAKTGPRPVSWPSWPGAGSYLATLRRQAMSGG